MFDFFSTTGKYVVLFKLKKKIRVITPSKYCVQAHLFLIKKNINLIANEVLSLDSWQIAILALSTESLDFFCVCWIFLTRFRK